MFFSPNKLFSKVALIGALLIYAGVGFSQDEDPEQVEQAEAVVADPAIEEVIVYAYKPGDEIDMDARYEDLFRTRAAAELDRLEILEDEYQWRVAMSEDESDSRIKWGYNPEADMAMRRNSLDAALTELPTDERMKPATLFRAQF